MRRISLVATLLILSGYLIIPIANGLSNNALISSSGTISYTSFTSNPSFGVHVWNHPDQALQMRRVKELGVSWIRYMIYWPEAEPSKGSYRWGAADNAINNAKANGLKILVLVNGVASWAGYGGYVDYGNFVYTVIKRYNPDAVELMNEPGIEQPSMSASQYVNFIKYGYQRAKEANPNIPVIAGFGQVSQPAECDGTYGTLDLAKLQPLGFFNYIDGLVIHPYTYGANPDTWSGHGYTPTGYVGVAGVIRYLREHLTSWGYGDIPLWTTEFGFKDTETGLENQIKYTIRECEILRDAKVVTIFYYCFWVPAGDTRAYPITLVNDDSTLSPKPLYNAYRDFLI